MSVDEALFRRLSQSFDAVVLLHDKAGRIDCFNGVGVRSSGLKPSDVIGLHWQDLTVPSQHRAEQKLVEHVFASGKTIYTNVVRYASSDAHNLSNGCR